MDHIENAIDPRVASEAASIRSQLTIARSGNSGVLSSLESVRRLRAGDAAGGGLARLLLAA